MHIKITYFVFQIFDQSKYKSAESTTIFSSSSITNALNIFLALAHTSYSECII